MEKSRVEQGATFTCGKCTNGYVQRGQAMSPHGLHSEPCPNAGCEVARARYVSSAAIHPSVSELLTLELELERRG